MSCVNVSPASLIDSAVTISPIERTATSVVPPPISITIFPLGWKISIPAPIAATFGSSSKYALRPPDFSAASLIAFCSTFVIFVGQQMSILGFDKNPRTLILSIKCLNIASVTSKSAITPSFNGRIASIFPGVLPTINTLLPQQPILFHSCDPLQQQLVRSKQFLYPSHE